MPKPSPNPEAIKGTLLPRTSPLAPEDYKFNVLLAGPPKSGKTHCFGTWPDPFCLYWDKNLATIRKFPGVTVVPMSDWQVFETYGIPALRKRCWFAEEDGEIVLKPLTCGTFGVDSISTMFDLLFAHLANSLSGFDLWAAMLSKSMYAMRAIVDLATPKPGLPHCHVVLTCHTRGRENSAGNLVKVTLNIDGQAKDKIPALFDSVFLARRENTKDERGNTTLNSFIYTVNPNKHFSFIGDGVGDGKFATLPAKTGGTYQELMTAWGVTK